MMMKQAEAASKALHAQQQQLSARTSAMVAGAPGIEPPMDRGKGKGKGKGKNHMDYSPSNKQVKQEKWREKVANEKQEKWKRQSGYKGGRW
jgi:hypothetical protein